MRLMVSYGSGSGETEGISMNATVVGRVGGLAAALGVGLVLTTGCPVAWADETDATSSTSEPSTSAPSTSAPSSNESTESPPATPVRERSRAALPTKASDPASDAPADAPTPKTAPKNRHRISNAGADPIAAHRVQAKPVEVADPVQPASPSVPPLSPPSRTHTVALPSVAASIPPPAVEVRTPSVAPAVAVVNAPAVMTKETSPSPAPGIGGVFGGLLAAFGIGPLAANSPLAPAEAPVMWGLLAWARKEFQRTFALLGGQTSQTVATDTLAPAATTTLAAAAVTSTPTTTPVAWLTGSGTTGPYLLPRTNNTSAKFGIAGTDVGTMWDNGIVDNPATAVDEHQILIAFGDTFSGTGQTGTWRSNVLLRSSDRNPADGITVPAGVIGDIFSGSPLSSPNFSRQIIKSPGYLGFLGSEVTIIPTAGISVPYNNAYGARQYVSYMSVKSWDSPGRWTTNYAAVAYSDDNGQTWTVAPSSIRSAGYFRTTTGYVSGNQNFQQSAFVKPPAESSDANYVYMFGTPSGRGGTVYLSRVNQASVLDQTKYEYWNGSAWVLNKPSAATPILPATTSGFWFFTRKTYPTAGEMSVQYNTYLNKYVMMYADSSNNVVMRTADRPEGPWSAPTTLATSLKYPGLYAPMMDPWTTGQDIYWNMSMWGDYNVLLMHTRLV